MKDKKKKQKRVCKRRSRHAKLQHFALMKVNCAIWLDGKLLISTILKILESSFVLLHLSLSCFFFLNYLFLLPCQAKHLPRSSSTPLLFPLKILLHFSSTPFIFFLHFCFFCLVYCITLCTEKKLKMKNYWFRNVLFFS